MRNTASTNMPDEEHSRVIERPDGYYWIDESSAREYGPFATLLAALQDMQAIGDDDFGEGVPLAEAEAEIGITDWIDPETSEPAEVTKPRLTDE